MVIKKAIFALLCLFALILSSFASAETNKPIPADAAFRFSVKNLSSNSITIHWQIADGYYLYRDRFDFEAAPVSQLLVGQPELPPGLEKFDPLLGPYEVYANQFEVTLPLDFQPDADPSVLSLTIQYQGCAEDGFCYPPKAKRIFWPQSLDQFEIADVLASPDPEDLWPDDATVNLFETHQFPLITASFFVFGLLLAFTPCVLPMLPIISGLVLGRQQHLSHARAFEYSAIYVLGMALTYALAGVLASLLGQQVQAMLQRPWLIVSFSLLFIGLALSLFGYYEIRLPAKLQNVLSKTSQHQRAGNVLGVFTMGVLSALLVSPCITPPLIGALTYMGKTGDVWLGGAALFALGVGMGIPLILFVTIGSRLLPKSGPWMQHVEHFFGVMLLGVAVWLLERILPSFVVMLLWAALFIFAAMLMGVFSGLKKTRLAWAVKGLSILLFSYGILIFAGGVIGNNDPLRPLKKVQTDIALFTIVKSRDDVDKEVAAAALRNKPVILDFYADWCAGCKHMDKWVFSDAAVIEQLQQCFVVLKANVTRNDETDVALQKSLDVIAPPTFVFFDENGKEIPSARLIGEVDAATFLAHLEKVSDATCQQN